MAEFYACAVTGSGIPAALRLGGPPSIGCQRASLTGTLAVSGPCQMGSLPRAAMPDHRGLLCTGRHATHAPFVLLI